MTISTNDGNIKQTATVTKYGRVPFVGFPPIYQLVLIQRHSDSKPDNISVTPTTYNDIGPHHQQ